MKHTRKILLALILVLTMMVGMTAIVVSAADTDYYLVGYINGADYGCNDDYQNLGEYKFVDGKLVATFEKDSYVFIKTGDNSHWYLFESYCQATSGTLFEGKSEKMFVPGGVELTFTLVVNADGSLNLSYAFPKQDMPEGENWIVAGGILNNDTDAGIFTDRWSNTSTANVMTYVDGEYQIVYNNVPAAEYVFKVIKNNNWDTSYPASDYYLKVEQDNSIVTITVSYGNQVSAKVEAGHSHVWSDATCTEAQKCECGETQGEVLGHNYVEGVCSRCEAVDPDYVAPCEHVYEQNVFYHPELVQATCCTPGVAVFECINCDHYYTEATPIDPEAHAYWGDEEIITPANCATETNGLKKVACANGCGTFNEVTIDYDSCHDWDVQKDVAATCTVGGEYYAVCKTCEKVESYTSEAQGHYNWYLTCGQTGTCMAEGCGVEFTLEHNTQMSPATCTQAAYCMNCWSYVGDPIPHTYVSGVCSVCEAKDPNYVAPDYVFEAKDLTAFDGDKAKGEELAVGTDGFFTLIFATNSKTQTDDKTFEDGYTSTQRLSFNGNTKVDGGFFTRTIKFTTEGPVSIKIWWNCGGDGRNIEIYTWDGEKTITSVCSSSTDVKKGDLSITTFELDAAGTYYLGHTAGTSYFYKVEVTKKAVEPECTHDWADATCTLPKTCKLCNATEGEAAGHYYVGALCYVCYGANPDYIANNVVAGENKVICNEHHLVADGDGQHGFPYEFPFFTVTEAGHYSFTSDKLLSVFIYTTEVSTEGADWSTGGAAWSEYVLNEADLQPGVYYIGFIYISGVGEYNVTITRSDIHTHVWSDATCTEASKCECGETQGEALGHDMVTDAAKAPTCTETGLTEGSHCSRCDHKVAQETVPAAGHKFVDGKCSVCEAADPDYVAPEQPEPEQPDPEQPEQPEPELNWFQKILKIVTEFFNKIVNFVKGFFAKKN